MPTPTFIIYDSGTNNPPRVVIEHSPAFPNWGLLYRDSDDTIIFQSNGTPVLNIGLGSQKVGIGTDSPNVELEVISTIPDDAIRGTTPNGSIGSAGVRGVSNGANSNGVIGEANNGGSAFGVWAKSNSGLAGAFNGNVSVFSSLDGTKKGDLSVSGTLTKGTGGFRIDHPLDPENKYLSHSFVESPNMLNVYNGNVTTDVNGDATVRLPDYFEALNQDFRYQLTAIGQFAQAIVAGEISNNQFTIKTDKPNVKVSWQVSGIRKDPLANMHRLVIEEDKPADERGTYLHPEAHGKPETQGVAHVRGKGLQVP